ncbi:MAG: 3-hydroxyacyl-CoA dehydrogenase NAD-binding domain-containing protein, partial [Flavobacteriaceae bacterium]
MKKIAVIGAGTMGNGIAHVFAQQGHPVNLIDISEASLKNALSTISKNLDRMLEKQQIAPKVKLDTLKNITLLTRLSDGVEGIDLVVEAASENIDIKKGIFEQLDKFCGAKTILATNTSSISITALAAATKRPDRVIG